MYIHLGEPSIADSLLQAALFIYGENAVSAEATQIRLNLALTRDALADPERALALGQQVYRDHQDDEDPGTTLSALRTMSRAYSRLGRHDEAIEMAERARAAIGPGGSVEQRMQINERLGEALTEARRVAESVPYFEEVLKWSIEAFGREDRHTSRALANLGRTKGRLGEIEDAEALLGESIAFHAQRYGENRIGYPLSFLGGARLRAGRFREAAAVLDSAITMAGPIIGLGNPDIGNWLTLRAEACTGFGAYVDAEQAARAALAIAEANSSVSATARGRALVQLGLALQGQGQHQEAYTVLQQALLLMEVPQVQAVLDNDEIATLRAAISAVSEGL
jgi:tetratricopeptide (TPR) repeat protein